MPDDWPGSEFVLDQVVEFQAKQGRLREAARTVLYAHQSDLEHTVFQIANRCAQQEQFLALKGLSAEFETWRHAQDAKGRESW